MTIIVRPDYHALSVIEKNGIRWIPPEQAERQDIRPLRIGILNIMPLGEQYEFNILHPLRAFGFAIGTDLDPTRIASL